MDWLGNAILLQTMGKSRLVAAQVATYIIQWDEEGLDFDIDSYLAAPMLDAKYEEVKIDDIIKDNCQHLNAKQQRELHTLQSKHPKLFDGTLGLYPGEPMHIELEEGIQPVYFWPYSVPHVHMATFKKKLDHLV